MQVDDRTAIAENFICQLWEKNYFSTVPLLTIKKESVTIISLGLRNFDAGPDFKGITVKLQNQVYHGDLEIHRAPEDWYQHGHHADPAYSNVILHLIIGKPTPAEPAIKLDRKPVPIEVFVDIAEAEFPRLAKKYQLQIPVYHSLPRCSLAGERIEKIVSVIDYFSRTRFYDKVERFKEQHQQSSWNQVLYVGLMEALGYSKNQIPFRKLANLIPFEALAREVQRVPPAEAGSWLQGVLIGAAGLLPSQDKSFDWKKINDQQTVTFINQLETIWTDFFERLGISPMSRAEWLFFRLRPANFPTRRIAGASKILSRFIIDGFLEKLIKIVTGLKQDPHKIIKEIESYLICQTDGYWAYFYQLENSSAELPSPVSGKLIGLDRAREIVINIFLPVLFAYGEEVEDAQLKIQILQLYQQYPKTVNNSIIKNMVDQLSNDQNQLADHINSAARQQGLIHLFKLFCRRRECDRCEQERARNNPS